MTRPTTTTIGHVAGILAVLDPDNPLTLAALRADHGWRYLPSGRRTAEVTALSIALETLAVLAGVVVCPTCEARGHVRRTNVGDLVLRHLSGEEVKDVVAAAEAAGLDGKKAQALARDAGNPDLLAVGCKDCNHEDEHGVRPHEGVTCCAG